MGFHKSRSFQMKEVSKVSWCLKRVVVLMCRISEEVRL